ncbi:hypothetical protein [Nocardia farcinica]|uniref:hypothetical protein n=1 Tax=Nocardia farcinica TaxID=37329 RepID=UPI001F073A38|nr:hypothetical protein [Nocardia farcinica]
MIFVLIGIRVTAARGGAYVALSLIALGAATAAIVLVGLLRPASLHQRLAVTDDGVIHLRSATAGRALLMSVSVSLLGLAAIALVVDGAP